MPQESVKSGGVQLLPIVAGVGWGAIMFAVLTPPSGSAPSPPGDPINAENEPKIGSMTLRLENNDLNRKALIRDESDKPTLVIAAGTCSGCQINAIPYNRIDQRAYRQVVFIYRTASSNIDWQPIHRAANVLTYADQSFQHYQALNAYWEPRYYLFDKNFVLISKQDDPNHLPDFVQLKSTPKPKAEVPNTP